MALCITACLLALAASMAAPAWSNPANATDAPHASTSTWRTPVPLPSHLWQGDGTNFPVLITPRRGGPSGSADDLRNGPAAPPWNALIGTAPARRGARPPTLDRTGATARARATAIRGPPWPI